MSLSLYFIPFFSLHQDAAEEPVYGSYVELFQGVLGDKKPIFKGNVPDDYLIIDEPHKTLKHDIINADIDGQVTLEKSQKVRKLNLPHAERFYSRSSLV